MNNYQQGNHFVTKALSAGVTVQTTVSGCEGCYSGKRGEEWENAAFMMICRPTIQSPNHPLPRRQREKNMAIPGVKKNLMRQRGFFRRDASEMKLENIHGCALRTRTSARRWKARREKWGWRREVERDEEGKQMVWDWVEVLSSLGFRKNTRAPADVTRSVVNFHCWVEIWRKKVVEEEVKMEIGGRGGGSCLSLRVHGGQICSANLPNKITLKCQWVYI